MKKIIAKSVLLFSPFAFFMFAEVFILPVDFFAFRAWEAVCPRFHGNTPGVFYANQSIIKWSAGDVNPRGPRTRLIDFLTDKHGFRNRPRTDEPERYDIVTIGDSLIAGSHLKQNEIISEVLATACNCEVYNYGGGGTQQLLQFMADPRFMEPSRRPRFVVFESRHGDFYNMKERFPVVDTNMPLNRTVHSPNYWDLAWDRFNKQMGLHSIQARLRLTKVAPGGPPTTPPLGEVIDNTRQSVRSFSKFFADRGIQFIFFVMPSHDRSFDKLLTELNESGIPTIAHLPSPHLPHGFDLDTYYFKDDSHWKPESVVQAAEDIWQKIQTLSPSRNRITKN